MFDWPFSKDKDVVIRDYCDDEWWAREVKNDPAMMKYTRKQRAKYYKKQSEGIRETQEIIKFEIDLTRLGNATGMYHFQNNQGETVSIPVIISQMKAVKSKSPLVGWYDSGMKAIDNFRKYGTTRPSLLTKLGMMVKQMAITPR